MSSYSLRYVTPFLGNVASFAGCYWVLWRLRAQGALGGVRVFPRLLASLGLADLLFHLGFGLDELFFIVDGGAARSAPGYCSGLALWLRCFEFVSSFQASYIALHFALQSFHRMPPLQAARGCVAACWAFGVGLALVDFLVNPWNYDEQERVCLPELPRDYTCILVLSTCFVASCVSYVLVVWRSSRRAPDSVLKRALRRAAMYPVVFIITYALLLACFLDQALFRSTFVAASAYALQSCNGLLNACAYACQGRYSVFVERRHAESPSLCDGTASDTASKIVEVGGEEVIEYFLGASLIGGSCCIPAAGNKGSGSF